MEFRRAREAWRQKMWAVKAAGVHGDSIHGLKEAAGTGGGKTETDAGQHH